MQTNICNYKQLFYKSFHYQALRDTYLHDNVGQVFMSTITVDWFGSCHNLRDAPVRAVSSSLPSECLRILRLLNCHCMNSCLAM